jgi:hypothetical protein
MRRHDNLEQASRALGRTFGEHYAGLDWLGLPSGPDFGGRTNPVFTQFMTAWSRKLVTASSLEAMRTELRESALRIEQASDPDPAELEGLGVASASGYGNITGPEFEQAVLAIDLFPRYALLLTVFEKLSIADAAVLLNADQALVRKGQMQALIELTRNIALNRGYALPRNRKISSIMRITTTISSRTNARPWWNWSIMKA